MKANRILLPIAVVAFASLSGCAVRYNDGYAYNDGYGYDSYATAAPPAVSAPPDLVVLPGTDIYAAPNVEAELYFVDGYWWRPWNGHWYRSHHYGNDWALVSGAPYFYRTIPHGWRDDYYQHRWNGRPWSYHHVSRDEAITHWDQWKRDRYWRDDRWATSRERYRRDSDSSEARYDQRRDRNYDRRDNVSSETRYDQRRYEDRNYQDQRGAYAPGAGYRRDDGRVYQREATSPRDRYDSNTRYETERVESGRTVRPVDRDVRSTREVRPTTRTRVEERHTAPAVRSTRPTQPAGTVRSNRPATPPGTVRRTEPTRRAPAVRSESPHHRTTPTTSHRSTTIRQSDRDRRPVSEEERQEMELNDSRF